MAIDTAHHNEYEQLIKRKKFLARIYARVEKLLGNTVAYEYQGEVRQRGDAVRMIPDNAMLVIDRYFLCDKLDITEEFCFLSEVVADVIERGLPRYFVASIHKDQIIWGMY